MVLPSTFVYAEDASRFNDMDQSHWAYSAIIDMANKGILQGYEDGTFRPDDLVTREQFAKILVLAMEIPLKDSDSVSTFADIDTTSWAYQYVEAVKQYLTGYKEGDKLYFRGDNIAVREDMAVAIVIAKGLDKQSIDMGVLDSFSDKDGISQNLKNYIAIAVKNHIMDGYGDGFFGPQNALTRAEAAELMYKSGILNKGDNKIAVGENQNIQTSNIFDLNTVKVGDNVAGMKVDELIQDQEGTVFDVNGIGGIFFVGQATISGTYEVVHEEIYGEDILYLNLDDESINKIPTYIGEQLTRIPITEDINSMVNKFGIAGTTGRFKIIIDNYFKSFMVEGYGGAKIVKIIELTKDSDNSNPQLNLYPTSGSTVKGGSGINIEIGNPDWTNETEYYWGNDIANTKREKGYVYLIAYAPRTSGTHDLYVRTSNKTDDFSSWFKYSFTVVESSPTAPEVISTSPVNGATNVDINDTITITYSGPFTGGPAAQILDGSGNILVGSVGGSMENRFYDGKVILTPKLSPDTKYTINLTGAKDSDGNYGHFYSFTFTTKN